MQVLPLRACRGGQGERRTEAATLGAGRASSSCMNTGVWCKYMLGRPLSCEGVRDEWQTVATVLQLLDKLLVPFEGVWDKCQTEATVASQQVGSLL